MDTNEEQELVHDCEENFYKDVVIRYQRINVEQWSWVLAYTWYATQSEVDDGMADSVGSIIMSDTLLITCCPFCGYRLTEEKQNTW
jgi:hypothetical protein